MPRVVVTSTAREDLDYLIETHDLPGDTSGRVARSIEPLGRFPLMGRELTGRWRESRWVLGPWRWMIIIYAYDEASDTVSVITIQDGRAAASAAGTADRP